MTADSRAHLLRKLPLFILGLILILLVVLVIGYLQLKTTAYLKTEPYIVALTVEAPEQSVIYMAYDYGYGVNDQHTRSLTLSDSIDELGVTAPQSFKLSLSAWKPLSALNFIAPKETQYTLTSLSIRKGDQQKAWTQSQLTQLHENGNRLYRLPLNDWKH